MNVWAALESTRYCSERFIPEQKQIFEFNFMPLKLKIVLEDSFFILNQYLQRFISKGTIVP